LGSVPDVLEEYLEINKETIYIEEKKSVILIHGAEYDIGS